jgi:mRNA-degrading endonuclease toxin of MazEF toxin-antitoxin module
VDVPLTTSLTGGAFRVRLRKGAGGVPDTSEAACEQIVQVPKRNFLPDEHGTVRPLGGRVDASLLDAVVAAVVSVISA